MSAPFLHSPLFRRLAGPVAGCVVSGLIWRVHGGAVPRGIFVATVLLAVLALVAPRLYAPVQWALEGFGRAVARGVTWVVLGLLFVGVFIPGRLLLALRRKDPLQLRRPAVDSYWELPRPSRGAESFDRQF